MVDRLKLADVAPEFDFRRWCKEATAPRSKILRIGERFEGFQKNGDGYKALCPCHADEKESLSIKEGDGGRVLVHCFAGCETADVVQAAGLTMRDLMPDEPVAPRMVENYDYVGANGELIYQTVRYSPKDFRQRRPDGSGGWVWNMRDVRRVLYRLPELRDADRKATVYVVEGEKDADRLASLGMLATTIAGGANSPLPSDIGDELRGRSVVVLPDNDEPGRKFAARVAAAVGSSAKSVKVVPLPGLAEHGDVSDWFDCGRTVKELRALVRDANCRVSGLSGASGIAVAEVSGLSGVGSVEKGRTAVPFPVDALPSPLADFAASVAESLPCPPDAPAALMLAVLGAMIGRKACISPKNKWREYPLLWVVIVNRSGGRKTPCFNEVMEPVRLIQSRLHDEYKAAKESAKDDEQESPPRLRQVVVTDTTIEALKDVLDVNPNGCLFGADEASGWVRSMSQYKSGRGDDRKQWLSIWSGQQIVSNRRVREPLVIDGPFVAIAGGIQEDVLPDLFDRSYGEDGFTARLLLAFPDELPPRDYDETSPDSKDYSQVCEYLFAMEPLAEPLTMSRDAKATWVEWINRLRRNPPQDNLQPVWSKAEGHSLRIALILFLSRKACGLSKAREVDRESVEGATRIMDYFMGHAARIYPSVADKTDRGRVGAALRWIARRGDKVTARQIQQYEVAGARTAAAAKELLLDLQDLGYGIVSEEAHGSIVFSTHPTPDTPDSSP